MGPVGLLPPIAINHIPKYLTEKSLTTFQNFIPVCADVTLFMNRGMNFCKLTR